MRLWHYELIPILPNKQLISQWRECCAIAGEMAKHGSPRNPLTRKIVEYPRVHFTVYAAKVINEMRKRGYKVSEKSYLKFVENIEEGKKNFFNPDGGLVINGEVFPDWHNDRYLKQCLYNLQEKYDCGMVPEDEWYKIRGLI